MKQNMKTMWSVVAVVFSLALAGFAGPALVSHINANNSDSYTGTAVVISHNTGGKQCNVEIKKEDGSTNRMIYGSAMSCYDVQDGMTLNIVEGQIKK